MHAHTSELTDTQDGGSFDREGDLSQQWSDMMMDIVQHCTCCQTGGGGDQASFTNLKLQCSNMGPMCVKHQSRRTDCVVCSVP